MALQEFLIKNAGGNCYVTVNGVPAAGASLWSQPYNGGPAQQWIPVQYPGNDPGDTGGVVCALFSAGTSGTPNLVITASNCGEAVTLQPFQPGNLYQLWAYWGIGATTTTFLNLASACMLDLQNRLCSGGRIQTYSPNGTSAQSWTIISADEAAEISDASALPGADA